MRMTFLGLRGFPGSWKMTSQEYACFLLRSSTVKLVCVDEG